jgi:chaperonin GroEL
MSAVDDMQLDSEDATGRRENRAQRSLTVPLRKIAENAGKDGAVILENIRRKQQEEGNLNVGYDVILDEYLDMVKGGVIDPAKVTRGALENAASIASMILTTEALITDVPEPDKGPAMPPGGMGGMDY